MLFGIGIVRIAPRAHCALTLQKAAIPYYLLPHLNQVLRSHCKYPLISPGHLGVEVLLYNTYISRALYFRANSRTREFRENLVLANFLHFSRAFYRYLVCQNPTIIKEATVFQSTPPQKKKIK